MHPDEIGRAREVLDRLVREPTGSSEPLAFRIGATDGSWCHMEVTADVLVDDPEVQGIVSHARDVTGWHLTLLELETSRQRMANVISHFSSMEAPSSCTRENGLLSVSEDGMGNVGFL